MNAKRREKMEIKTDKFGLIVGCKEDYSKTKQEVRIRNGSEWEFIKTENYYPIITTSDILEDILEFEEESKEYAQKRLYNLLKNNKNISLNEIFLLNVVDV